MTSIKKKKKLHCEHVTFVSLVKRIIPLYRNLYLELMVEWEQTPLVLGTLLDAKLRRCLVVGGPSQSGTECCILDITVTCSWTGKWCNQYRICCWGRHLVKVDLSSFAKFCPTPAWWNSRFPFNCKLRWLVFCSLVRKVCCLRIRQCSTGVHDPWFVSRRIH